jgi:hypothetical protein
MQQVSAQKTMQKSLEARYAYYRRCQELCKGGQQCKAPAEKGGAVCYAHARQRAMAERRGTERRAVLAAAAAEMSRRAKKEFEMADLFTSFNGIQVTIATVAQAIVDGRIDCKTAGRLLWDLQRMAKLLSLCHRVHRKAQTTKEHKDENRAGKSEQIHVELERIDAGFDANRAVNECEKPLILKLDVLMFPRYREWSNGPPEYAKAA